MEQDFYEIYNRLLHHFLRPTVKKYINEKDLLNIAETDNIELMREVLLTLIRQGIAFKTSKNYYTSTKEALDSTLGEIDFSPRGTGFVKTTMGTVLIPSDKTNSALAGDTVLIKDLKQEPRYISGKVYKIVKRKHGRAYFEVKGNGQNAELIPYNSNNNVKVRLETKDKEKLIDGSIVEITVGTQTIKTDSENDIYIGQLTKTIGSVNDPSTDLYELASELGISYGYSEKEEKEVEQIPTSVSEEEKKGRKDLTSLPFITIDCDGSKDRDDAVYAERLENGNIKLYVSISHVSHYIKMESEIYKGIKERKTSHYPRDKVFAMIHHIISNGICSLNEGQDRLTRTVEMEITKDGNIVDYDVYQSVINSKKAMTYSKANKLLSGEKVEEYEQFRNTLEILSELNDSLERKSKKRRKLNFSLTKTRIVTENDETKLIQEDHGLAGQIIENCMIAANQTVAKNFAWLPIIFRIHEEPEQQIARETLKELKSQGLKIDIPSGKIEQAFIYNILNQINSKEEFKQYNETLLAAMKKARYDTSDLGHYALQLKSYCHFTSPIRRIADFMVHIALDELDNGYNLQKIEKIEKEIRTIAIQASVEERVSERFEQEAKKQYMAQEMEKKIGQEFNGTVIAITPNSLRIRLDNLFEGDVRLQDIHKGGRYKYRYDKVSKTVYAKGEKGRIKKGTKVLAKVLKADPRNRTVNLEIE